MKAGGGCPRQQMVRARTVGRTTLDLRARRAALVVEGFQPRGRMSPSMVNVRQG